MASNVEMKDKSHITDRGIIGFFKGLKAEFRRFTWPTKEDIKKSTIAVIVFCAIFVAITGLMDKGFASLFNLVFLNK
ncbi:preprotein translocase subunit SecE [Clostridium sp. KNHs214]|uniref:preprotein translocase subunit SecE n=1 Tax=Clostridium sp. KNHs214 TaxID=1540257 RepID=UPI0005588472|nr:preprotein translocase subunit SecE [Clostridium sp. KNHs214]